MSGCADCSARGEIKAASSDDRSDKKPSKRRGRGRSDGRASQMASFAFLLLHWADDWGFLSLRAHPVSFSKKVIQLATLFALTFILIAATTSPSPLIFTDVTIKSGSQLLDQLQEARAELDAGLALRQFESQRLFVDYEGLTEFSFERPGTLGHFELFFIPVSPEGPPPSDGEKSFVLRARGPVQRTPERHQTLVFFGTVTSAKKGNLEVLHEGLVKNGTIHAGNGQLKNFFKCAVAGCASAGTGCLAGGPDWIPCFCLWCGGAAAGCAISELFLPTGPNQ